MNLALRYLYAYAEKYQNKIDVKEFTINSESDYIFSEILTGEYDIICFSTYIWNETFTRRVAEDIKRIRPNTTIVLGGPEVSFESEAYLKENWFIDIIIRSEGEIIFKNLLDHLSNDNDLSLVKGITYRKSDQIISNDAETLICNLDEIPFPYTHVDIEKGKILYYETSRGCPFNCSYCMSSTIKGVRNFSLERVKKDLKYFLDLGVPQVKFIDRTFNTDIKRCVEIMKYIIENDNKITNFHFEVCGDLIDEAFLNTAKASRRELFQLEMGVQSTNEDTLDAIGRKNKFEILKNNVEKIMTYDNMHVHLDLIAGLPLENYELFKKSFNMVYEIKPHHLQLGFLKILKGSKIKEQEEEHLMKYRKYAPYEILGNKYISAEQLVQLKHVEGIVEKYFNKAGFRHTLSYLEDYFNSPFELYETFAIHWRKEGNQHISHKKDALYDIFEGFINTLEIKDNWIKELIKYDYVKASRPKTNYKLNIKDLPEINQYVHELLHNEEFVIQNYSHYKDLKAKEILKKLEFVIFEYNIDDYIKGDQIVEKRKKLCIVDYGNKNVFDEASILNIDYQNIIESGDK